MNNPLITSDKFKNAEMREYASIKQLSIATGLPTKLLKLAKVKSWPGFHPSSRVNWKLLKPVIEAKIDELQTGTARDLATLKELLAEKDLILKDLEIKKKEGNYLEPDDVKKFLVELATKLSVIIKKELLELPPRLAGKNEPGCKVEIDNAIKAIFDLLETIDVDNITNE